MKFSKIRKYLRNIYWIMFFILGVFQASGQEVEHNYLVGPQSTNCDSLNLPLISFKEAVKMIENSSFRFQQQFKISRTYGVMNAKYYSCDGEKGFLIMKVDKVNYLYLDVPKTTWDLLIKSPDINALYDQEIRTGYEVLVDE
jgi:hypothetical protein